MKELFNRKLDKHNQDSDIYVAHYAYILTRCADAVTTRETTHRCKYTTTVAISNNTNTSTAAPADATMVIVVSAIKRQIVLFHRKYYIVYNIKWTSTNESMWWCYTEYKHE